MRMIIKINNVTLWARQTRIKSSDKDGELCLSRTMAVKNLTEVIRDENNL